MRNQEIVIVGGGPAGAACAAKLVEAGLEPLIVDKQGFPRHKICAGWLTPGVFNALGLRPEEYPLDLTVFPYLRIYLRGIPVRRQGRQYAIRRKEFDHWLLNRSGAEFIQHEVKDIQPTDKGYRLDGEIEAEILIGAGGTHCPVYRKFYAGRAPRSGGQILALEDEFLQDTADPVCRLWFFENDLPGYAWYVPKKGGYVNIGVGGKADLLKKRGSTIKDQWDYLVNKLRRMGLVRKESLNPRGYVYYLRGDDPQTLDGNLYLVGDSAGLATLDMGEGIGPAILSGQRAAEAILGRDAYRLDGVPEFSLLPSWLRWLVKG